MISAVVRGKAENLINKYTYISLGDTVIKGEVQCHICKQRKQIDLDKKIEPQLKKAELLPLEIATTPPTKTHICEKCEKSLATNKTIYKKSNPKGPYQAQVTLPKIYENQNCAVIIHES